MSCNDCLHDLICEWCNNTIDKCRDYEPKRVKCDDNTCVKERYEYHSPNYNGIYQTRVIKTTYCPKCGTRIEANE
jgi:hypothetical protein